MTSTTPNEVTFLSHTGPGYRSERLRQEKKSLQIALDKEQENMSATLPVPDNCPPRSILMEEEDWILLLDQIKQRNVIPVIGPDLIRVPLGNKLVTYEDYVALQLAQRPEYGLTAQDFQKPLGLEDEDLQKPLAEILKRATLNDVMSVCFKRRPDKWPIGLHLQVWQIVNNAQLPVPPALTQLAEITDFDLLVTSTFDPMMERALTVNGTPLEVRSYLGLKEDDIEELQKAREMGHRFLYYLFGKAMRGGNYDFATCDVELLRLLVKLQDATYRPPKLFDELRQKHLLLLGVNFSDWLARFFLWLAKGRSSESNLNRKLREYLADTKVSKDRSLVLFLEHFSDTTTIVGAEPEEFVAELHRRWSADTAPLTLPRPRAQVPQPDAEMPENAVFLSYSRVDQVAVETLYAKLAQESIPVWYDAGLGAGDLWKDKIRQYINSCKVFIPVVSSNALRLDKSEFRAEWKLAVDLEADRFGMGETGIVPIVVDQGRSIFDTLKVSRRVKGLPDEFPRAQMYHCPDGKAGLGPQGEQQWLNLINHLRVLLQKR